MLQHNTQLLAANSRFLGRSAAAIAVSVGIARSATALTVNLAFSGAVPGSSSTPGTARAVIRAAADIWEDIIQDSHTLSLTVDWVSLPMTSAGQVIGDHNLFTQGGTPHRETSGRIRFHNAANFYFLDSTPFENEEFTMTSSLWRNLSVDDRAAWYDGTANDVFESFFSGNGNSGQAMTRFDLLSIALHEIGHALGMSESNTATQTEIGTDLDYDFSTSLTGGLTLAAETVATSVFNSHLVAPSLMQPTSLPGTRTLPAPTDVFSMAAASQWTDVDLPRKYFHDATGGWATSSNWIGNNTPDFSDDVYILEGNDATLTTGGTAGRLFIGDPFGSGSTAADADSSVVVSGAGVLVVADGVFVEGDGSFLSAQDGGEIFISGGLNLDSFTSLSLLDGSVVVNGGLRIDFAAQLVGNGTVEVASGDLINNNDIIAAFGDLVITGAEPGALDLDGASLEAGHLIAPAGFLGGNLVFNGALNDAFAGFVDILPDRSITFSDSVEWGNDTDMNGAEIDMVTASGEETVLAASVHTFNTALITVTGDGDAILAGAATTSEALDVSIESGATLRLMADYGSFRGGLVTFRGGSYTGAGTLSLDSDAVVFESTTIDVETFDWDGLLASHTFQILPDAVFTINSESLDLGNNSYDGILSVGAGSLIVNTELAWIMDGEMSISDGSVDGQRMIVTGAVTAGAVVSTTPTILADVHFSSGASLVVNQNALLRLNGDTEFSHASNVYSGPGTLQLNGDVIVSGDTTFDVATVDLDGSAGSTTIRVNATKALVVNADALDTSSSPYDGTLTINAGSVSINTPSEWTMSGTLNLNGVGEVLGATTGALLNGQSTLIRGDIVVKGTGNVIDAPVTFGASASVAIGADGQLDLFDAATFVSASTSFTGLGDLRFRDDVIVEADTVIDIARVDLDGSSSAHTVTVEPNVVLTVNSTVIDISDSDFDGSIVLNGGSIVVNTTEMWTHNGVLELHGPTSGVGATRGALLAGSAIDVDGGAVVQATGLDNSITAETHWAFFSNLVVNENSALSLDADAYFNDPNITGLGTLRNNDSIFVLGSTTIDVASFDWDGDDNDSATFVESGVTLTLNVDRIETDMPPGFTGFDGVLENSGTVVVNTPSPWSSAGTIAMNATLSRLEGANLVNSGLISGQGTLANGRVINNGVIAAVGGRLVIDTAAFSDLDGNAATPTGALEAIEGDLHVLGSAGVPVSFAGTLDIAGGHEFRMESFGLANQGAITLNTGTYAAPILQQAGDLAVGAGVSILQTDVTFAGGGATTIGAAGELRLVGVGRVDPGHALTGAGTLVVTVDASLVGNGSIGVDLAGQGTISPGLSVGSLSLLSYSQSSSGTFEAEIESAFSNDLLVITDAASLDGSLSVELLDGFIPDWGDEWTIMTYGSVEGDFASFETPTLAENLLWWSEADADAYRIGVRHVADIDHDGAVDFADLNLVVSFYNTFGASLPGDADEDGDVDFTDLNYVVSFFNTFAPANVVPSPGALALFATALVVVNRRARKRSSPSLAAA